MLRPPSGPIMKSKLFAVTCLYLLGSWVLFSRDSPISSEGTYTPEIAERFFNSSGFVLPVIDDNPSDNLTWGVPFNYFGHYYQALGGYHPGEDWNLVGGSSSADLGKPVYAVADGTVVRISNLASLGQLVALKHTGTFTIPGKIATENRQSYSYRAETVNSIYSVYMHISNIPASVYVGASVQKGVTALGYIMNPGGGPHLHFELRHPNAVNSNDWSLVGSSSNWARNANGYTGYYLNLQKMVDAGVRDPKEFIFANSKTPTPTPTPAPQCGNVSFAPATNFAAGLGPYSLAVGDLNGDRKLDLAVANSHGVSVVLGTGTGRFGVATSFAAGLSASSVALADLNGDGKLDLIVANSPSAFEGNVSILLGTGTGSFSAATNFAVGGEPRSLAIGDVNGDGKLDLAVANFVSNSVSILLGTGTGSFGAATNFAVGLNPISQAAGDFNGDGKLDLAVANYNSNTVSVLLGSGTGSFGAASKFTAGSGPFFVADGDFNGDGKLDLVVANNFGNNVSILLGTGIGSFGAATKFAVDSGPAASVAVGDLNGDGKLDLATTNSYSNNVSILQGTGNGSFRAPTNFAAGKFPQSLAGGDLNGDGKLDLAVANSSSANVSILLNNGPTCQ